MGILGYIILGLIVGAIAKAIMPGRAGEGWGSNLVIGVIGAIVGGWIGNFVFNVGLGSFWNLRTWTSRSWVRSSCSRSGVRSRAGSDSSALRGGGRRDPSAALLLIRGRVHSVEGAVGQDECERGRQQVIH